MTRLRAAVPGDAQALTALRAAVHPYAVTGVEATRRALEAPRGSSAFWVAVEGGEVTGSASASPGPELGDVAVQVHPRRRGHGTGSALLAAAVGHLAGARRLRAFADAADLGFARRHGFEPGREVRYAARSLAEPLPAPDPGTRTVSLRRVDARELYEADVAARADEPDDVAAAAVTYETWRSGVHDNPDLDLDLSTAALAGGGIAAFTLVLRHGDRIWSDMTATLPRYRRRGLAYQVKTVALSRAAAAGVAVAYTSTDGSNVPMLAVNDRLGYRLVASRFACLTPPRRPPAGEGGGGLSAVAT